MSLEALSAVWNLDLDKNQQDVLEVLAWHANADMVCWPSKARIMYKTGLSDSTVKRTLGSLKKSGLITVEAHAEGGRGKTPLYKLHPEKGVSKPPFEEWRKGVTGDDKGGQGEQEKGGRAVTPEPKTKNQEQEPSNPPKPPQGGDRPKTIKAPSSSEYVAMYEAFERDDPLGELVGKLVRLSAAENKTGRKRYSAAYTGFVEPLRAMRNAGMDDTAIRHGLEAALKASAPSMNYVKKAAQGYEPDDEPDLFRGGMSREERAARRSEGRPKREPDLPEDFDPEAVKREWERKVAEGRIGLADAS